VTRRQFIGVDTGRRADFAAGEGTTTTVESSSSTVSQTDPVPTTTSTVPPKTPPPISSPLVLAAGVTAGVITLAAAWRASRMRGK
jgi:hypothetical protein